MGLFGVRIGVGGGETGLVSAERIDKIGDEIFFGGAFADDFFFVADDDFGVGDFDDFATMDGELRIHETFDGGALDDDLLNDEILGSGGKVDYFAEPAAFFAFDFEADGVEVEGNGVLDFDDVVGGDELVGVVDNDAEVGIFADAGDIEDVSARAGGGAADVKGDDFKGIWVDNGAGDGGDLAAGLDAENWGADKLADVN